jgi:hypothetical protein
VANSILDVVFMTTPWNTENSCCRPARHNLLQLQHPGTGRILMVLAQSIADRYVFV